MQEKELRKMTRSELIEIIYAMQQNEKALIAEKEELQAKLDDRILRVNKAGSIAEAALSVNKVLEACQQSANDYLASIAKVQEETKQKAEQILTQARKRADEIVKEAQIEASKKLPEVKAKEDE